MRRTTILALSLSLFGGAAAAQVVHPGHTEGLGLWGPGIPQVLREARANPYALPDNASCETLAHDVATLDSVLGPDLDNAQARAAGLDVMAGVRAVLPYGEVVRFVTGAGRREQALIDAAMAGWERRGFLKGTERVMGCPVFGQPGGPTLYNPQGAAPPSPAAPPVNP